jgi:hypothetical protein
MKLVSRYALIAALGLGVATVGVNAPAFAKKKEEAAATPALKLSEPVRKALAAAQDALAKSDLATAETQVAAAKAAATTDDDKYMSAAIGLNVALKGTDQAKKSQALDDLLASGKVPEKDKAQYYAQAGHWAYDAKNYAKAESSYAQSVAAGSTDQDVYARLADVQFRNNKPQDSLATLQKVINDKAAAGQPVPTEWYARGADIASRSNNAPKFVEVTTSWLSAYPTKQNWHDSLFIYNQMANLTGDAQLDQLRLARAAGVLPLATQNAYLDYAVATYLKYPNEAVSVLKEGIAAGKLNPTTSQNTREILAISEPKIATDKASLKGAVAASQGPKATFKSILSNADLFYGYADYKNAADLYKLAAARPDADKATANLRLGAALAQAGDKAGAAAAFDAVPAGGPQKALAGYWKVLLDHPAA